MKPGTASFHLSVVFRGVEFDVESGFGATFNLFQTAVEELI